VVLQQIRNFALAKNDFSRAISLDLKTADVFYKRGVCFYELGNKKAACKDFNSVAEFNKKASVRAIKKYCM